MERRESLRPWDRQHINIFQSYGNLSLREIGLDFQVIAGVGAGGSISVNVAKKFITASKMTIAPIFKAVDPASL